MVPSDAPRYIIQGVRDSFIGHSGYASAILLDIVTCPYGFFMCPPLPQVTSQPRLEPDVRHPHPGSTTGYHQELQALGGPHRPPAVPSAAP